ncbi:MAG: GIY-YIG nuclease family protein [Bacteroidetes bacterium]|jgi:putative endonuclease|nr:GIY-YIG nuclease family protein [Bacteroidota bacterium]
MHVYILYSQKLDRFYVGQTALPPEQRLEEHNSARNENSFTTRGIPWTLFLTIACDSRGHAKDVEQHIKRMKSKAYICNLKRYPEMRQKLAARFREGPDSL